MRYLGTRQRMVMEISDRRLLIPHNIPEDFAHAAATILILGMADRSAWDCLYSYPAEISLAWIRGILEANPKQGLLHAEPMWWENQLRGH